MVLIVRRPWRSGAPGYLVTGGDLRITVSRVLERGGRSSTDSGLVTSCA